MLCDFCCYAAMDSRKTPIISAKKWGSIFKKAKSLLHLTVTGGEPFIRKDFVEIIDNIIQNCGVPRISIKTNGFYKDRIKDFIPKLINKHKNTEFTLSVSLDGPENIHDKVRNFKGAYNKVLETIDVMKTYRNQPNFFLRLASVITKDNKHILEDFFNQTSSWPIDFHELILVRDVPTKEQLELKEDYQRLAKIQQKRSSTNWKKSFNGKLFDKIYLETIKRIDNNKVYSPCLAGKRFVEIFPDGVVKGCEVKKLWSISKIGSVNEGNLDIVDIVKSRKAKEFSKFAKKCTCTFECANAINTVYDPKHWLSLI
jgi:sulfatase maturation enzyme AslB (radical SAM superfamily)